MLVGGGVVVHLADPEGRAGERERDGQQCAQPLCTHLIARAGLQSGKRGHVAFLGHAISSCAAAGGCGGVAVTGGVDAQNAGRQAAVPAGKFQ